MPKVDRSEFIAVDQHRLAYLNVIEKLNCAFCRYANGVLAYAREISARSGAVLVPPLGTHARYVNFLDYGDPIEFH